MSEPTVDVALLRLLQLASPGLPVGAYAYSQGLEWAVAAGWVDSEESLAAWLEDQLTQTIGTVDLPILARLYHAVETEDESLQYGWSRRLIAFRETRELVADDCDRGRALARLLRDLGTKSADRWVERDDVPFAALVAVAAAEWKISLDAAAYAYAWGWLENQVLSGVKLIPLGQVAGQRLLLELSTRIPAVCRSALVRSDDDIGGGLPLVALASCLHETQYTRLFRS